MRVLLARFLISIALKLTNIANHLIMTQKNDWKEYLNWVATVEANEVTLTPKNK